MDFLISKRCTVSNDCLNVALHTCFTACDGLLHDIGNVGLGHTFDGPPTQCSPLRLLLPIEPDPVRKATCRTIVLSCRLIIISINTNTTVHCTGTVISNLSIIAKCVCGYNVSHASHRPTNRVWAASCCRSCQRPDTDAIPTRFDGALFHASSPS